MKRTCQVEDCTGRVTSRGWCEKHYRRWRRTGSVADQMRGPMVRTVEGCDLPVDGRGLCHGHFQRRQRAGSVQAHIPLGRRRQPEVCTIGQCADPPKARGLCSRHWWREWRHGEAEPDWMVRVVHTDRPGELEGAPPCMEEDCKNPAVARDRCGVCYKIALRAGSVEIDPTIRVVTGEGWLSHGYWVLPVDEADRHLVGGDREIGEHRLVIARHLARPLHRDEQVHHINGVKTDNRLDNLELWSKSHPSGQRVEEKVDWALQMLLRYRPDLLADR